MGVKSSVPLCMLMLWLSLSGPAGATASQDPNANSAQKSLLDMSIEELMEIEVDEVYGASKHRQTLSEAPASVTIITADEIRKYGYRTLADILASAPGFYMNYDRNYHYIGVRGFRRPGDYDTRILLLVDGHRVNENVGDTPALGTQFILDIDLIKKVEIIRGPGSSLYGSNALLAVVNVITATGEDRQGVELSGEVGSFDTQKARVTYGESFANGLDLLVSGTSYTSDGPTLYFEEFDDPATADGIVENDDDEFRNLVARATWGDFSFLVAHTAREKGLPTAPWGTVFGDRRTRAWDDTTLVGLTYNREISETWTLTSRVAYNHYNYDGRYVYDYADEGDDPYIVVNHDYWKGRRWEGEVQVIGQPVAGHTFTAGSEFLYHVRQDQACWDEDVYLDDSRHGKDWGIYIQDEFKPLENLTFVGGVRYDRYESFGGTTNPRLALIYNVLCDTTYLKLLYGEAFRAPDAYELYYHDGGDTQKPAQDLDPERIDTYEVVLEHRFSPELWASASGFYYAMDDLIDQYLDPADDLLVFRNLDKVKAKGIELALNGRWDNALRSRLSYSYVEAEDDATGETLVDSPKHLAKLNVITPVIEDRLFAGLEVQYDSKAKTLEGDYTDDFILTHLTLTYMNSSRRLEISAGIYNLFDAEYAYPGFGEHMQDAIEQDGRTFRIKLTYRF